MEEVHPGAPESQLHGEHPSVDLGRPGADWVNKRSALSGPGTYIEIGDHQLDLPELRTEVTDEPGKLRVLLEKTGEHKTEVFVIGIFAIGAVLGAVHAARSRSKK